MVAGAQAQLGDPGEDTSVDTERTPVAKETKAWVRVAGADFNKDEFPEGSWTPIDVEFYNVAFENQFHGFAGGAQCEDAPSEGLASAELEQYLQTCPRVPVIYEYVETSTGQFDWHVILGGRDDPGAGTGYVGAIGFMRDGSALAVGGDGKYPKREPTAGQPDPAGEGRGWIYEDGIWRDLTEFEMQPGMRGMTALGMSPRKDDCEAKEQCALAGALRQMWLWRDGRFVRDTSGVDDVENASSFRFRVRDVRFNNQRVEDDPGNLVLRTEAVAVTSGCCDPEPANNHPQYLFFDGKKVWPQDAVGCDSMYSLAGITPTEGGLPETVSAVTTSEDGTGRPPLPSGITGTQGARPSGSHTYQCGPTQTLSSMRLVAGAGMTLGVRSELDWAVGARGGQAVAYTTAPEDDEDLMVLDCPGSTAAGGVPVPNTAEGAEGIDDASKCEQIPPDDVVERAGSDRLFKLPAYPLLDITFSDQTESVGWAVGERGAILRLGGVGSVVTGGANKTPPKLGSGSPAAFGGADVYAPFRPLPTDAGTDPVPSLYSQEEQPLDPPALVAAGTPNAGNIDAPEDVSSIVMSRDGTEGWAIGPHRNTALVDGGSLTLFHFDGTRWARCDTRGSGNILPADPACAALDSLRDHRLAGDNDSINGGVKLIAATRVPYENDDNPSNDDEFEVVAVGTRYKAPGLADPTELIVRYRDGRWFVDEEGMGQMLSNGGAANANAYRPAAVAFTAPDDGWLLWDDFGKLGMSHWDGEQWQFDCNFSAENRTACGDDPASPVLPLEQTGPADSHLAVAGNRLFLAANRNVGGQIYPVIVYKDPGGNWTSEDGGYDPGCAGRANADGTGACLTPAQGAPTGRIYGFRAIKGSDGYEGWAAGRFGDSATSEQADQLDATSSQGTTGYLMRLDGTEWKPFAADDAVADYFRDFVSDDVPPAIAMLPSGESLMVMPAAATRARSLVLRFDPERERWGVLRTPFSLRIGGNSSAHMLLRAVVSDGQGGAWIAGRPLLDEGASRLFVTATHFFHYTGSAPKPVFEEAPHPVREQITGGTAGADGSFWVTTNSSSLYRYDRLTGWDKVRVPGWDPGRLITRTSEVNAVAVGPDGQGVAVGKDGRMAQLSPGGVQLDPAAGRPCADGSAPPCGTANDLRAVAVAPDGSALAGGDRATLLFRPAGGQFRALGLPGASGATSVTAISYPSPDRAWVALNDGRIVAGKRSAGSEWSFGIENLTPRGDLLSIGSGNQPLPVRALQVDRQGEGYAVGDEGLIMERRGDASSPWQRIKTGFLDDLRSVALAPGGRDQGVLVGGRTGLILTLEDGEFRPSREADLFDPLNFGDGGKLTASVVGVALVPGFEKGQVEAWAVQQVPAAGGQDRGVTPGTVLHYTNAPDEPLMQPRSRVKPQPDTPDPRPGELSFAAFGRSDCQLAATSCPEFYGTNLANEVISRRITDEILERSKQAGGPKFAIFTGDVGRAAGREGEQTVPTQGSMALGTPVDRSTVHRRWIDFVADRLAGGGVPIFGALGSKDLSRTGAGDTDSHAQLDETSLSLSWRQAMAGMPAPWGTAPEAEAGDFHFEAVRQGGVEVQENQARTHYAVDICNGEGCPARMIVLDNSLKTLSSSDVDQNPIEPNGGQLTWLEQMLSERKKDQQAIVVMTRPTFTYGPGAGDIAGDATAIETTLMRYKANVVVTGHMGWNGRYWATSPALHEPCAGGTYIKDRDAPEGPDAGACDERTSDVPDPTQTAADVLAEATNGLGAPPPPGVDTGTPADALAHILPFVVASSAGGRFGPDGNDDGPASDGYWHGYSIIRLDKSGDTRKTIVEQRPVFDWISLTGPSHVLKPGERMTLRGEGREPVGIDTPARYDRIDSPAITHRYNLVHADEQQPGLPKKDENGEYIPLPGTVATINEQTGQIRAGKGRQGRTFAIAILSVGDKAASWPVAFEPARSFTPRPAKAGSTIRTPAAPRTPVKPTPPAPRVLSQPPTPTQPPPPAPPVNAPTLTELAFPPPPNLPALPATPTGSPTPLPPPPPAPPPPPTGSQPLGLTLQAPVTPVSIVPTVVPPTPPPINPAPPGGSAARKEARQRQAATAKSEEGGGDEGAGQSSEGGDGSSSMVRRDRSRAVPSINTLPPTRRHNYDFTAVSHNDQPSAWARGSLYGGMTVLGAFVLAIGWGIARPTPRRRHPPTPAPGLVRSQPWRRN